MKKNKLIIAVAALLILVATVVSIFFLSNNKKEDTEKPAQPDIADVIKNEADAKELMSGVNNAILNGASKEEISKILGVELSGDAYAYVQIGKDSYLQFTPPSELVQKHDLSNYVKQAAIYASRVEEKIKSNFAYEFVSSEVDEEGSTVISVNVRSYLYQNYIADLGELQGKLLENFTFPNDELNDRAANATMYKAKVKAMEIMDSYLDNYVNDEYASTNIILENGQREKGNLDAYISTAATGMIAGNSRSMLQDMESRVATYMNNALSNGTLDRNDMLKLKAGS